MDSRCDHRWVGLVDQPRTIEVKDLAARIGLEVLVDQHHSLVRLDFEVSELFIFRFDRKLRKRGLTLSQEALGVPSALF